MSDRWGHSQRNSRCRDRDASRAIGGKTVNSGRDGGKSDGSQAVRLTNFDSVPVAGRQRLIFTLVAGIPDRSNRVDDMPRRQPIAGGDFSLAGLASAEGPAFGKKLRAGCAMDRSVDATAAQQ